jgi:hypothetical protein
VHPNLLALLKSSSTAQIEKLRADAAAIKTAQPFAPIDLADAVNRQHAFASKMANFSWSRSPFATQTLESLVKRYDQFFQLMVANPDTIMAPTLDQDLAWHTHQLNPRNYRNYCFSNAGTFINHNDTISKDEAVSSTKTAAELYQSKLGASYGLCLCWHCEASRHSDLGAKELRSKVQDALLSELARRHLYQLPLAMGMADAHCNDCGLHPETTCAVHDGRHVEGTMENADCNGCNGECGSGGCGSCSSQPIIL